MYLVSVSVSVFALVSVRVSVCVAFSVRICICVYLAVCVYLQTSKHTNMTEVWKLKKLSNLQ